MAQQQPLMPAPRQPRPTWGGWLAWTLIVGLITWPLKLIFAGPVGYSARRQQRRLTAPDTPGLGGWAKASAVLYVLPVIPVLLAFILPPSLILTVPAAIYLAGATAASPAPLRWRDLTRSMRALPARSGGWRIAAWIAAVTGTLFGLLMALALLGTLIPPLAHALTGAAPVLNGLLSSGAIAAVLLLVAARTAGETALDDARATAQREAGLRARIAQVVGVRPDALGAEYAFEVNAAGEWAVSPTPPGLLVKGAHDVDGLIAAIFPDLALDRFDAQEIHARRATPEVLASREIAAQSDGLIVGIEDAPDTVARPEHALWLLAPGTSPAKAETADALARREGLSLVEWQPYDGRAAVARLTPLAREARDTIASVLGSRPWEVEAVVETGDGHPIERVDVVRMPLTDAAKAHAALTASVLHLPGGSEGWTVRVDAATHTATLAYGERPVLPAVVEGRALLPAPGEDAAWSRIPAGRYADGTAMVLDLKAGPHTLVVGGTGSGKSTFTRVMLSQALVRGFDLVYADAAKRGAGLYGIQPYARAWETTGDRAAVASLLQAVYAEVQRRVALIAEHRAEDWRDLPDDLGIKPMLVVVDEFRGHVAVSSKAPGPKGTEAYTRWEAEAAAAAGILDAVGRMAAEARSAGIHLVLLTQRPDATIIPGDVRENLGTVIQLVSPSRPPSRDALGMVLSQDSTLVAAAQEEIARFNDGRSPGLAVVAVDGGGIAAARVGYLRYSASEGVDEAAAILAERGVMPGVPLPYDQPGSSGFGTVVGEPAEPIILDLDFSGLDFSTDGKDA